MSKTNRGSELRETPNHGRGVCPLCKRSGVKVVFEVTSGEKTTQTCKMCKAAVAHGKLKDELAALTM